MDAGRPRRRTRALLPSVRIPGRWNGRLDSSASSAPRMHLLEALTRDSRDFGDLIHLIHLHRLRVDDDAFRRLVEKYGPSDVLERIRHAVRSLPPA